MTATLKVHIALFFFIAAMVAMAARLVQLEVQEKDFLQDQGDARTIRCLLYTSPSPRDATLSRMPSSA